MHLGFPLLTQYTVTPLPSCVSPQFGALRVIAVKLTPEEQASPMKHGIGPMLNWRKFERALQTASNPNFRRNWRRKERVRLQAAGKTPPFSFSSWLLPWHNPKKGGGGSGYGLTEHPVIALLGSGEHAQAIKLIRQTMMASEGPFKLWRDVKSDSYVALNSDDRQNMLVARSRLCLRLLEPLLANRRDGDVFVDDKGIHYRNA